MASAESAEEDDAAKYSKLFVFTGGNKAGMQDIDKERQAKVIYELSKNTAYFKRAAKLDEQAAAKVAVIRKQFDQVQGELSRRLEAAAEQKMLEWEAKRSFGRVCCVLDMDMFFAAVEIRDQPHLKDLPVAVGGNAMISTSNYVARKYGVRAAMPGFIAKKLCPNLVFVRSNFAKYKEASAQVKAIIAEYDPHFVSYSLDEVYFDLTDSAAARLREKEGLPPGEGDTRKDMDIYALRAEAVVQLREIRRRVTEATGGLTCSAGVANNFMIAKICADINKPDGQYELPPTREAVISFVDALSTRKIPGIGKVSEKMLEMLGMKTMGDVRKNIAKILHGWGGATAEFLLRACLGMGSNEGQPHASSLHGSDATYRRKSIGCERTYSAKGISDPQELREKLHAICERVSKDMVAKNIRGRRVTVKVKDPEFHLHTHCQMLRQPTNDADKIESMAWSVFEEMKIPRVRLLGVAMSDLSGEAVFPKLGRMQASLKQFLSVPRATRENAEPGFRAEDGDDYEEMEDDDEEEEEEEEEEEKEFDFEEEDESAQVDERETIAGTSIEAEEETIHDETRSAHWEVYAAKRRRSGELQLGLESSTTGVGSTDAVPVSHTSGLVRGAEWTAPLDCPVCSMTCLGYTDLNTHLDACLNGQTVSSLPSSSSRERRMPSGGKRGTAKQPPMQPLLSSFFSSARK